MDATQTQTNGYPMHTVTFEAANKMAQETYHAYTWNEFHTLMQVMRGRGWAVISHNDRTR